MQNLKCGLSYVAALALSACNAANDLVASSPSAHVIVARPPGANEEVLYSFQGGSDGADPLAAPLADASGALYGTTAFGGDGYCFDGCGTVFKLTRSGSGYVESVLYSFQGSSKGDGAGPAASLVGDKTGALYGTAEYGGDSSGEGVVFKLTPAGSRYTETILHQFKGGQDGTNPLGGLTMDATGSLFGSTLLGGGAAACGTTRSGTNVGCGTLFELKRSGSRYREHVLYRFQSGKDGATPGSPPIVVGRALYGTTATGGGAPSCGGAPINPGCGTSYKLTPARKGYTFSVLHAFSGTPDDAANAFGGLLAGGDGALYGVSQYGGSANLGSVFELSPSGSKYASSLLHSFTGGSADGSYPLAAPALGKNGTLYGTTQYGGSGANAGIVFELRRSKSAYAERVLQAFDNRTGGEYPVGGILIGNEGVLYGTTTYGGTASGAGGTVFSLRERGR